MSDPSKNPNADGAERKRRTGELTLALSDLLKKHAEPIAAVAEDTAAFYRSLLSSCFISILTIQAITDQDKTKTVREHMREQYAAGRDAYVRLAEVNSGIWDEPPVLTRVTIGGKK